MILDKINSILKNKKYIENLKLLEKLEENREFCKHDLEHFLSVSRITYIKALEKGLDVSKDVIYAFGLLHDIGRVLEYTKGIEHQKASVIIASDILKETEYTEKEKELILNLIDSHRKKEDLNSLEKLIKTSDKESRNCFNCKAYEKCYWSAQKKNNIIKY